MHRPLIFAAVLLTLYGTATSAETNRIEMGDGHISGSQLSEYQYTWKQCSLQEGEWVSQPDLTESADIIGDLLRVSQTAQRPDGGSQSTSVYLKRDSLSPVRIEVSQRGPDGKILGSMRHKLNNQGYQALIKRGDASRSSQGTISSEMYLGTGMGLPLSQLSPDLLPAEIAASMLVFDASYRVILTDAGSDTIEHNGQAVETRMIDVEWHHLGQGDIYPPGPDASGGRYWVTTNPPESFPYVPRYKTDTYAIEYVADTCQ